MPNTSATSTFQSLALDVGLPVGLYFLLHDAFGMSIVLALIVSSIPPAIREIVAVTRERHFNALAGLILATNVAGIVTSFITGDPRLIIAKNSIISSVIAVAILVSVAADRPLMSEGLQAFMVKGEPERTAAWNRLREHSPQFHRWELRFSVLWGLVLLADCVARLIGAFTLPVSTMSWGSTVILLAAIALGSVLGGVLYASRMQRMLDREMTEEAGSRPQMRAHAMAA